MQYFGLSNYNVEVSSLDRLPQENPNSRKDEAPSDVADGKDWEAQLN